jgi:hypothetical protein
LLGPILGLVGPILGLAGLGWGLLGPIPLFWAHSGLGLGWGLAGAGFWACWGWELEWAPARMKKPPRGARWFRMAKDQAARPLAYRLIETDRATEIDRDLGRSNPARPSPRPLLQEPPLQPPPELIADVELAPLFCKACKAASACSVWALKAGAGAAMAEAEETAGGATNNGRGTATALDAAEADEARWSWSCSN